MTKKWVQISDSQAMIVDSCNDFFNVGGPFLLMGILICMVASLWFGFLFGPSLVDSVIEFRAPLLIDFLMDL
jgi:hypothetical protein